MPSPSDESNTEISKGSTSHESSSISSCHKLIDNDAPPPVRTGGFVDAAVATATGLQPPIQNDAAIDKIREIDSSERSRVKLPSRDDALDSNKEENEPVPDKYDHAHEYVELPASTHTLLHTEPISSVPFLFSLGIAVLSAMCLILVLNSALKEGKDGNRLNVPEGITSSVAVAQYCGILVGLLMEQEIPQGLILMRDISKESFQESYPDLSYNRFFLSCLLRLVMGYLFLMNLFVTIVQADDVIQIFFDILALEFVQHLDDMAWELGRKDILGRHMKVATCVEYKVLARDAYNRMLLSEGQDEENVLIEKENQQGEEEKVDDTEDEWRFYCLQRRKKFRFRWILKVAYFINCALFLIGTIIVGEKQKDLDYHCKSVSVAFGEEVWEEAYDHTKTKRKLIYSYFNGVYETKDRDIRTGYPIYTERNKNNGEPYKTKTAAEIVYCQKEEAWIFRHQHISKQNTTADQNDCQQQWLLRSPKTKVYDLMKVPPEDWSVWTGVITPGNKVSIVCNTCESESDCNYNGKCTKTKCDCNGGFFGLHCEFEPACSKLIDDKGEIYTFANVTGRNETSPKVYNRPIYKSRTFRFDEQNLDLRRHLKTCYPTAKRIRLEATPGNAISMFEFQALSSGVNVAFPEGTATQSSDLIDGEILDASRAIDGSYETFSHTLYTNATWELSFTQPFPIESIIIANADCGGNSNSDPRGCLCRLSNATLSLIDEFDEIIISRTIGDTCNQRAVFETFSANYGCIVENATYYSTTDPSASDDEFRFNDDTQYYYDSEYYYPDYAAIGLVYSGSRWFGTVEGGEDENFQLASFYGNEYHAFWDDLYDAKAIFLSDPTTEATPIGADFYQTEYMYGIMPWEDYGPYGLLKPMHNLSGKGYFHCFDNNRTEVYVASDFPYW